MQILIAFQFLAFIISATIFLWQPVRTLRFVARHLLLQARGLEARERAIQAERSEVWEVV
jgi:hypothetical protein